MTKPRPKEKTQKERLPETEEGAGGDGKNPEPKKSVMTMEKLLRSRKELGEIEELITETHGRELWLASKTAIAVVAAVSMDQRGNPLVVVFEGGSGKGKSFVINLLEPDRGATHERLFRLDSFTPKSFVSHAANRSKEALNEIDLLPKLKDKTLLVKELAPVFRGREDALRENFAMLTAVLDGKGLMSASGTHGTRGYEGRYVFNLVGGTTPIPPATDRIMSQLGNRMFRYEIAGAHNAEKDLVEFAKNYSPTGVEDKGRKATNSFIAEHFKRFGVSSVQPSEIHFSDSQLKQLVRCATLLCIGRVEVTMIKPYWGSEIEYVAGIAEGPHRVIIGLKLLAQGLALISGREEVDSVDLEIVRHVVFSSIPQNRRLMLRALLVKGGTLTSGDAEKELRISRPTARNWMKELGATGLAEYRVGHGNEPDSLTLSREFSWLLGEKEENDGESPEEKDEAHGEAEPTEVTAESH
jgi:hypothetical protein